MSEHETSATFTPPTEGTILAGPFWAGPVEVVSARLAAGFVRMRVVLVGTQQLVNLDIPLHDYVARVHVVSSGTHTFDASPRLFRLALEALRTRLAHAFDPQFAVSVSQVDPLPHQIEAVYKRILPLPKIRFLLADDPGAGKTIMAGLLMRELMQRQDVRRVLVLCPKALTDQWRREMWERFRQPFEVLIGETVSDAFGQNAWMKHDRVIASVDLAAADHILPSIEQSNWDLVIFDEAHKLSAYSYGGKVEKTRRYQLAEKMAERTRHLLLMTATPHKGDPENFRLLLSLLDRDVFATQAGVAIATGEQSPFFLRRMKEAMKDWQDRPLFLPRHVSTPPYNLSHPEFELYEEVTRYVRQGMALANQQADSTKRRNVGLALTVLQRRLASSLHAVTRSLERRHEKLTLELEALRISGRQEANLADTGVSLSDDDDPEDDEGNEEKLSGTSGARNVHELAEEVEWLARLVTQARTTRASTTERKLQEFERVVQDQTVQETSEKILIFTEHRDTLDYLVGKLREWGRSVCSIHGGMKLQDRIAAEREFRRGAQFMVATDAAGEGINLQFCRVMINWDLPWNPNRLEQRMGRIHRYGQQSEVQIFNLVAGNTREGQVLTRLLLKLQLMKADLGHDQVFDVISEILDASEVRLDTLLREATLGSRSIEDILSDLDTLDTQAAREYVKEALGEALATRFIDTAFLLGEERESKERRLTPEFVEHFFADALTFLGGRLHRLDDRSWRLEHVPAEIRRAAAARNVGDAGTPGRVTFLKERARAEPPAELLAPDHPLFDAVVDAIWERGQESLLRGTAFVDPNARESALVWLVEAGAANGLGDTVHRRLLGVRQTSSGFELVEPGFLLDLAPDSTAAPVPPGLRESAIVEAAIDAATASYSADYLGEVSSRTHRETDIVLKAVNASLSREIESAQETLLRQQAEADAGRDMNIAIQTTLRKIDGLTDELTFRRGRLENQAAITLQTPRIVGVAAVLPAPVPHVVEHGGGGDQSAVELAAMKHVMEFERAHGRIPDDVSKKGCGYDIKSIEPGSDSVRYIEVKGHATTGDVTLYYTEWQIAHRMRSEFYIYEVNRALSAPDLRIVQDPVGCGIEPEEKVVEYKIKRAILEQFAVPVAPEKNE